MILTVDKLFKNYKNEHHERNITAAVKILCCCARHLWGKWWTYTNQWDMYQILTLQCRRFQWIQIVAFLWNILATILSFESEEEYKLQMNFNFWRVYLCKNMKVNIYKACILDVILQTGLYEWIRQTWTGWMEQRQSEYKTPTTLFIRFFFAENPTNQNTWM